MTECGARSFAMMRVPTHNIVRFLLRCHGIDLLCVEVCRLIPWGFRLAGCGERHALREISLQNLAAFYLCFSLGCFLLLELVGADILVVFVGEVTKCFGGSVKHRGWIENPSERFTSI